MIKKAIFHGTLIFLHHDADLISKILENAGFLIHKYTIDNYRDGILVYEEIFDDSLMSLESVDGKLYEVEVVDYSM